MNELTETEVQERPETTAGQVVDSSALLGFVVELQPGCWLCDEIEGDPGRTLKLEHATRYPGIREAEDALTIAKTYRHWVEHNIRPIYKVSAPTKPNG